MQISLINNANNKVESYHIVSLTHITRKETINLTFYIMRNLSLSYIFITTLDNVISYRFLPEEESINKIKGFSLVNN